MKFIPKEDLLSLISHSNNEVIYEKDIIELFHHYGDEYYIEGGSWGHCEKCIESINRKEFMEKIIEADKED